MTLLVERGLHDFFEHYGLQTEYTTRLEWQMRYFANLFKV